jgi:hypothetical protein
VSLVPGVLADLLIVAAMIHDWRTRGRPHRAYVIAGACTLVVQLVRVPLSATPTWRAIIEWLQRLL